MTDYEMARLKIEEEKTSIIKKIYSSVETITLFVVLTFFASCSSCNHLDNIDSNKIYNHLNGIEDKLMNIYDKIGK